MTPYKTVCPDAPSSQTAEEVNGKVSAVSKIIVMKYGR